MYFTERLASGFGWSFFFVSQDLDYKAYIIQDITLILKYIYKNLSKSDMDKIT